MKRLLITAMAGVVMAWAPKMQAQHCDPFVSIRDVKIVGNSSTGKNDLVVTIQSMKAGAMSLDVIWKNLPGGAMPAMGQRSLRVSSGATTQVIATGISPTTRVSSIGRFVDFTTGYGQPYITLNNCR